MAADKILIAFDESDGSRRALKVAADLVAVNENAHADIVYVVPIPLLDDDQMESFKDILNMMVSDGEQLLGEAVDSMGEGVSERVDSLLLTGTNPANEILKLLEQRDYGMVVIGNRGLSGLKEYTGSVSHKVLAGSKVPVLIVK